MNNSMENQSYCDSIECNIDVSNKDRKVCAKSFPQKLMELLSREDLSDYITWNSSGDVVVIKDESLFEKNVLRKLYKKNAKYSSFRGKLYRWGFKRFRNSDSTGGFSHRLFLRDQPSLCLHMRRNGDNSSKNTKDATDKKVKTQDRSVKSSPAPMNNIFLSTKERKTNVHETAGSWCEYMANPQVPQLSAPVLPTQLLLSDSPMTLHEQINKLSLREQFAKNILLENATIMAKLQAQALLKNNIEKMHMEAMAKILTNKPIHPQLSINLFNPLEERLSSVPLDRNEFLAHSSHRPSMADIMNLQKFSTTNTGA